MVLCDHEYKPPLEMIVANKQIIAKAVRWSAIDVIIRNGVSFIVLIVLARILTPEDFGLIAMLAIFTGIAALFIDGGFGQAIIQRKDVTQLDLSSIFFFNIVMGLVTSLILVMGSSLIASFYNSPSLKNIAIALSVTLAINSFGAVHASLLQKKFNFLAIALSGILATLLSGIIAIAMAMMGKGVWSLVAQIVSFSLINVAMMWVVSSWRPDLRFSMISLRSYFGFSSYIFLSGVMYVLQNNLYAMLIGKSYPAQSVGFFSQAQKLQQLPNMFLTSIVSRVGYPMLALAIDDQEKMRKGLMKAVGACVYISLPLSVVIYLLADTIIASLFGDKWLPAAEILKILSVLIVLMPLHMLNIGALKALGYANLNMRLMFFKLVIGTCLLFLALPYGLEAVAWSLVITGVINLFLNTYYSRVFLGYGLTSQLADMMPYVLVCIPMALVILLVRDALAYGVYLELFISIAAGASTYLLSSWLMRMDVLQDLLLVFKKSSH